LIMTEQLCRTCGANPPVMSGLCSPCWVDAQAELRQRDAEIEARRAAAIHGRGPPAYRVERPGHSLGRGRHCGDGGRRRA